jgi:DNA-nicking Smr family endonuclease
MQRRVARGRIDIGGTLDLHGFTQNEARARLERFIGFAAARGEAVVLVVTGKGNLQPDAFSFAASPRGILRQRFLEWIEAPPLRGMITSVRPAHQRHGGRGAFYVFLRRYSS